MIDRYLGWFERKARRLVARYARIVAWMETHPGAPSERNDRI